MTTTTTTRPRPLGPTSVALRLTCDATVEVAVDPALDDNERDDVAAGRAESQLSFHGADQTSLISTTTSPIASLSPRGRQALERAGRAPTSDETAYMGGRRQHRDRGDRARRPRRLRGRGDLAFRSGGRSRRAGHRRRRPRRVDILGCHHFLHTGLTASRPPGTACSSGEHAVRRCSLVH